MGQTTRIGWTDKTWNPWYGCAKVSPGCDDCYMFTDMRRYGRDPEVVRRSKTRFHDPLRWTDPARVFTCSWSDFFIAEADGWRTEAWDIIARTPHLTYQILTKRPARIKTHMPSNWWLDEPWRNVWLGTTVESRTYRHRIDVLREVPAAVRFLSLEPLLEDLGTLNLDGIGWVIVGGLSGKNWREHELNLGALLTIAEQCRADHLPLYVKQDSAPKPGQQGRIPDDLWIHEWPALQSASRPSHDA